MWSWWKEPKIDIAKLKQDRDIPGMIQALGHHEYWMVRNKAARALGELKDPEALNSLSVTLLKDGHWLVRWSAAMALLQIGDRRACSSLAYSMKQDRDRHVRIASKFALQGLEKIRQKWMESVRTMDELSA